MVVSAEYEGTGLKGDIENGVIFWLRIWLAYTKIWKLLSEQIDSISVYTTNTQRQIIQASNFPISQTWQLWTQIIVGWDVETDSLCGRRLGPGPYDGSKTLLSLPTLSCSPAAFSVGNSSWEKGCSRLETFKPEQHAQTNVKHRN